MSLLNKLLSLVSPPDTIGDILSEETVVVERCLELCETILGSGVDFSNVHYPEYSLFVIDKLIGKNLIDYTQDLKFFNKASNLNSVYIRNNYNNSYTEETILRDLYLIKGRFVESENETTKQYLTELKKFILAVLQILQLTEKEKTYEIENTINLHLHVLEFNKEILHSLLNFTSEEKKKIL